MPSTRLAPRAAGQARSVWQWLLNRRNLLRIGPLGLAAALLLGDLHAVPAAVVRQPKTRSAILLWMAGCVTLIASFDPKPAAPEEVRGTFQVIARRVTPHPVLRIASRAGPAGRALGHGAQLFPGHQLPLPRQGRPMALVPEGQVIHRIL